MYIFWVLLQVIFFATIFVGATFLIEKIKTTNTFFMSRISVYTKTFLEGMIYSVIVFAIDRIMYQIYPTLVKFYFMAFFVLMGTRDRGIATMSLFLSVIYDLIKNDINMFTYGSIISIFAATLLIYILNFFLSKKKARLITTVSTINFAVIIWAIMQFGFEGIEQKKSIEMIILTPIGAIITEVIVWWVVSTSVSANLLYESNNYFFSKYFRSQIKNLRIGEIISEKKIEKAIYGNVRIDIEKGTSDEKREALETVLIHLERELPKETIFFQAGNGDFGYFYYGDFEINIKEAVKDPKSINDFKFLNNILTNLSKEYKLINGNIISANVRQSISIYGEQSYSLKDLQKNCEFSFTTKTPKDRIVFYDPSLYRKRFIENKQLKELDDAVVLQDLAISFEPYNVGDETINIARFDNISDQNYVGSIDRYVYSIGMINTYNKFLSAIALRESKGYKETLAIPYSFTSFDETFNIDIFINRIKISNVPFKKIILYTHVNEIELKGRNKKILEKLGKLGIRFAVLSPKPKDKEIIEKVKPDFIFLKRVEGSLIDSKYKNVLIDANEEYEINKALSKGVKYFAGNIISKKSKPHILDKQSKIYIETLLGGKNE